jgi:hypothetical protein
MASALELYERCVLRAHFFAGNVLLAELQGAFFDCCAGVRTSRREMCVTERILVKHTQSGKATIKIRVTYRLRRCLPLGRIRWLPMPRAACRWPQPSVCAPLLKPCKLVSNRKCGALVSFVKLASKRGVSGLDFVCATHAPVYLRVEDQRLRRRWQSGTYRVFYRRVKHAARWSCRR